GERQLERLAGLHRQFGRDKTGFGNIDFGDLLLRSRRSGRLCCRRRSLLTAPVNKRKSNRDEGEMLLHTPHPPAVRKTSQSRQSRTKMCGLVYTPILTFHSWLRWITLLLAVGATLNATRRD